MGRVFFQKARAEQAAIKLGIYGPPGSGKSFTSLLIAEGLAARAGKRVAYVDTERGTDFYAHASPKRPVHPEAFDFDALYTKSLTETVDAVRSIDQKQYAVVVLDSITHLWDAARDSFSGKLNSNGQIPFHAWGKIKSPYKSLLQFLLNSPLHFIICGREGTEYETDEVTKEVRAAGKKMRAEGETPYEPHILIRMAAVKPRKTGELGTFEAIIEKDRTGVLAGRVIENPTFDSIALPILALLGDRQAQVESGDEAAERDAERVSEQDAQRASSSQKLKRELKAKLDLVATLADLKKLGAELSAAKAKLVRQDLLAVRDAYLQREAELTGAAKASEAGAADPEADAERAAVADEGGAS